MWGGFSRGSPGWTAHLGFGGSWGPPPCSFFTSISLLRLRASRSFPKEPLRRKEPLPSCGVDRFVSVPCRLHSFLAQSSPYSPRSTRLQALPPRDQPQTEPRHPRACLGCHGGLRAHRCRLSAAPPPWSGLQGPGPEGGAGASGGATGPDWITRRATQVPAHTPAACRPTCLRLRLAQSSSVCAASSLPWRRYRAPKLRNVVLTVGLRTGERDGLQLRVPQEPGPILTPSPRWP